MLFIHGPRLAKLAKVGLLRFVFKGFLNLKPRKVQNLGFLGFKFSQSFSQKTVSLSCFSS